MSVRHYVLLATDGFIYLPTSPEITCPDDLSTRQKTYVFGFLGGLYKVDDKVIDKTLNWKNPKNWRKYKKMMGKATIPSPMIWGEEGDRIYVTLINLGMKERPDLLDGHTVHMHGAHVATQLDGFPETSFEIPMWMDFKKEPPYATYLFEPENPGTYMYHCHVEASEHVQMGMYGGLIIYPSKKSLANAGITQDCKGRWYYKEEPLKHIPMTATNRNFAYNDVNTYFDKEYVMLLSDIDSRWHESVLKPDESNPFNPADFRPDFWLVNGRAFPDTLLPHPLTPEKDSNPNVSQINYESYVHVKTGDKFLLRMINMGYQVVPWHIHGWHFSIIGKDAHLSPWLKLRALLKLGCIGEGIIDGGFTAAIASGETYDLLLSADDKRPQYRKYIVNGQDGLPSLCSQMAKLKQEDENAIFDIPLEPVDCESPKTTNYIDICNQCSGDPRDKFFPQFYPMHNHDDYKVTNGPEGLYPGGQLAFIQIDEPDKRCKPVCKQDYDEDEDDE